MTSTMARKPPGDISSVFPSLSGKPVEPLPSKFKDIQARLTTGKQQVIAQSWNRLITSLDQCNSEIKSLGTGIIPIIDANSDLIYDPESKRHVFSPEAIAKITKAGTAVIRNAVPKDIARQYKYDLDDYIAKNPVKGFPAEKPTVFELYWSPSQIKARSHPGLLRVQEALLNIWHGCDNDSPIVTRAPLVYADRLRIRLPGDSKFRLGPHMDGGSVERWEDLEYSNVYNEIHNGNWETYDAFDYTHRLTAKSDLHQGGGACGAFRMFQGWLSMSETGPGEGTLQVYPNIVHSTAYTMLRPYFAPRQSFNSDRGIYDPNDNSDLKNWAFVAPTNIFPNSVPGAGQELNEKTHPHLDLSETMVSMPQVYPGDYVVWHCDMIHAVESIHQGTGDSSVMYIPVVPLTANNVEHLAQTKLCFETLEPPPDFPGGVGEKGFQGVGTLNDIDTEIGLQAFGYGQPLDINKARTAGEKDVIDMANNTLWSPA
jgi:hypothetical protein